MSASSPADNNTITNAAGGIITVGDAVNVGAFGITASDDNIITNLGQIIVGVDLRLPRPIAGIVAGDREHDRQRRNDRRGQ